MSKAPNKEWSALELAEDRALAQTLVPVSRETLARLDRLVEILLPVAAHTNLIARSTIPHLWTRHIADSLQLLALAPNARIWVDLGSGAGFPGLVLACALAGQPGSMVHLVESVQKKAAFLRDAALQIQVPATVHAVRIEDFGKNPNFKADVVTARALAPLDQLLRFAHPLLRSGALGLFPKGQDVEGELTQASKSWNIEASLVPSQTNALSRIVVVQSLAPLKKKVNSHVRSRR
jgi:16S rRNA (guanine527-N7)-methyltransferase